AACHGAGATAIRVAFGPIEAGTGTGRAARGRALHVRLNGDRKGKLFLAWGHGPHAWQEGDEAMNRAAFRKDCASRAKGRLHLAFLLVAAMIGGLPCDAKADNAEQIIRLRSFLLPEAATQTPDARQDFAAALIDYWKSLSTAVPPLSEDDARWLQENANTGLATRAEIDPRYARFRVLRRAEVCLQYLERVAEAYAGPPSTEDEASAWLGVLECHEDDGDTERFMAASALGGAAKAPKVVSSRDIRRFLIDHILRRILTPS
ncbi:MAG: hypothetical protein ACP5EN_07395, partial [Rhodovulum sp.]